MSWEPVPRKEVHIGVSQPVMPICTTCATYAPYLYTIYESAYNLRLEQCEKCKSFVDPYVEHDSFILLLDLILLKRGVYRHLIYNRGARPRRAVGGKTAEGQIVEKDGIDDASGLSRARWGWTLKLGAGLVILDAFIRWTHLYPRYWIQSPWEEDALITFPRALFGSLVESLAFHTGVTLSCFIILNVLNFLKSFFKSQPRSDIAREFKYSLVPLTLFYSSLPKLFLLFLLTIWLPSPLLSQSQTQTDWLQTALSQPNVTVTSFLYEVSQVLDDDKIDAPWIIRNILGGMSAGFGLRVILDIHPFFSMLIMLSGWAVKTAVAQLVGDWVSSDRQTSQAWLAYSIP